MKKKVLFCLLLTFTCNPVYAFSISSDMQMVTNIFAIGLVFLGLVIVFIGKLSGNNKDVYVEKEKNLISGLNDEDKINEEKAFDPDSIFKVLPNFSSKKFEDNIKEEINKYYTGNIDNLDKTMNKELLQNTEILENFTIDDLNLIDFNEDDEKYTIKSIINSTSGTKKTKVKNIITVTSVNKKVKHEEVRCPVCGGKIKDLTKLRCNYCGSILPNNNEINNDEWIIEGIEKK